LGTFRTIVGVMQSCPACGWRETRPSPRRSATDFILACLLLAPHRCQMCRTRFFRFSIPAGLAEKPEARPPVKPRPLWPDTASAPTPPVGQVAAPSVLILADDIPVRKLLRRILERDGYQIHELAESTRLGPELRARPVDLVIADLDLTPDETIRLLQPLLSNPDPRVIVLSSEPLAAHELLRPCTVLEKPFRSETLLANVKSALCAAR